MILNRTLFYLVTLSFCCSNINAQNKKEKILWDSSENLPVQYATIKSDNNYAISNEKGYFNIEFTSGNLSIQNLSYQKIEIDLDYYKNNDTIFMNPKVYVLDEIVVIKDEKFNNMVQTILTDYALEPHQEKFFLRAVIKKNNELYKIVDLSGRLEKNTLFDTRTKPMPKKNYTVVVDNIRKVGLENRSVDFEMFSFDTFLNRIASIYMSPKIYNLSYKNTNDDKFSKIIATPKDINETKTEGYYFLDNLDNTFNEVYILNKNDNSTFTEKKDIKYRTTFFELKTNFKRNLITNKYQLNLSVLKSSTEVISNKKDIFEITYIYYANPLSNNIDIKNNINLNIDLFDINGKYDENYWGNHEILPLTDEMQEFINKVNSSSKNSDFKTKTNIK